MAIKCHSGFVHYNMFHNNHCHGGGNNYGSIFNITNNCGGGTSFWGGLGAGLGFGLGNLFGGFFGNMFGGIGNMFGGFGMGNMFGMGGFGGFGGWGNGMSGLWGGGAGATAGTERDYSEYSSRRSSRRSSSSCDCGCKGKGNDKDKKDIDNPKFKAITGEIAKLVPGNVSEADYNRIKESLDAALKATDGIQKAEDQETYKNLLNTLDNLKNGKLTQNPVANPDGQDNGVGEVADNEVSINGTKIIINSITIDTINCWTGSDINGLTQDKATAILKQLGYVDNNNVGKMSANYKVLLLLQKSGVNVQCATNPSSDDTMVQGKISGVTLTDGKLSYTIDNGTADGDFKFKYSFQQVDDVNGKKCFHLTKIDKNGATNTGYVENSWKTKIYIFQYEQQPLLTSGSPLVSHKTANNRIKLEDVL